MRREKQQRGIARTERERTVPRRGHWRCDKSAKSLTLGERPFWRVVSHRSSARGAYTYTHTRQRRPFVFKVRSTRTACAPAYPVVPRRSQRPVAGNSVAGHIAPRGPFPSYRRGSKRRRGRERRSRPRSQSDLEKERKRTPPSRSSVRWSRAETERAGHGIFNAQMLARASLPLSTV